MVSNRYRMKRVVLTFAIFTSVLFAKAQQNILMSAEFWRSNPNLETVQSQIAKGNSPSQQNEGFFDPVVMAINNNASNDITIFLINQSGNGVHKKTHHSRTYLHWAAAKGNIDLVNYLIQKGSDVNYTDSHGESIIAYAANANKNTEVFEALFKAGIDPKNKLENGSNLIMSAIANDNDLKVTDYFIKKGVSINDKDNYGRTVADYAAKLGNFQIINQLVARGVYPTDQALFFATQGSRQKQNGLDVYQKLIKDYKLNPKATNNKGQTLLHLLANRTTPEIINFFINQDIDLNKTDNEGNSILSIASAGKDTSIVITLIKNTNNINSKNENGESALTKAIANGPANVANVLIKNGADINVLDNNGNNLAYYWFNSYRPNNKQQEEDFEKKLTLLKNAGLDFTKPQQDGNTLLHLAVEKNNLALINKAISLGIDINAQDQDGNSALHKAALTAKDDKILTELIKMGINKDLKTEFDETAYDLAKQNDFLKQNNINIDFLK